MVCQTCGDSKRNMDNENVSQSCWCWSCSCCCKGRMSLCDSHKKCRTRWKSTFIPKKLSQLKKKNLLVVRCFYIRMTDGFCNPPSGSPRGPASGHRHHLGHVGVGSGLIAHRQHPLHRDHGERENITHTNRHLEKKSQRSMKSEYFQSSLGQPDCIVHEAPSFQNDIF